MFWRRLPHKEFFCCVEMKDKLEILESALDSGHDLKTILDVDTLHDELNGKLDVVKFVRKLGIKWKQLYFLVFY